ncbi:MAG: hypothetical protein HYY62_02370 [Deltaproteobacteria bacterium]|nr:hypothetical protein [Deltaproteobacteria bacterium]
MRGKFIFFILFLTLGSVEAQEKALSISQIWEEVRGSLSRMDLEDIHSFRDTDFAEVKKIVRLRKSFLEVSAKQEGVKLHYIRTRSLIEGLMTFYHAAEKSGQSDLAQKLGLATAKLLTVKGLIKYTLATWQENRNLFSDLQMKESIPNEKEIDYATYFNLLRKMANRHDPKSRTLENEFYRKAKEQYENYTTYQELWLELIRATDEVNGEYTRGLKELIRRGYFGKKEALGYFVTKSVPAEMVRSMVHFYFMRAFSEAYLSLYHWDERRLLSFFEVLKNPMMHASFITFSIAADRARKAFAQSSAFYKLSLNHPLVARSVIDAGPLFTGMIVSDVIFRMIEHPRFKELWWLTQQAEVTEAASLFLDLAEEVWFRRSFLARAVASTVIFSGYNLALYSTLKYGGEAVTKILSRYTSNPFYTKVSFSPASSFIAFTSAFIVHDLVMEQLNPILSEWDWQDRLKEGKELVKGRLQTFQSKDISSLAQAALQELHLDRHLNSEEFLKLLFQKKLSEYLDEEKFLTELERIKIKMLEEGVYKTELLSLARSFKERDQERGKLSSVSKEYPLSQSLFQEVFSVLVSFEFLDQVYSGYREFFFRDLYQELAKAEKVFLEQKKEILKTYLAQAQAAEAQEQTDLAFRISLQAQDALLGLKKSLLAFNDEDVRAKISKMRDSRQASRHLHNRTWVRLSLYPEKESVYQAFLNTEEEDLSPSWALLFSDQIRFYFDLSKEESSGFFKPIFQSHMVRTLILSQLKEFQVRRGIHQGLEGWIEENLTSEENNFLILSLKDLDPKFRSQEIRRLFHISD